MTSFQDSSCESGDQQLSQRKCLMPVLFSGETTLQIGRKVLDFIRYLLMEQKTRRKEKEEKSGLTSGGTRLRIQDALLSFVPLGRS